MKVKTILVPTDFSANAQLAFKAACDLARLTGAVLHVTHVAESDRRTAIKRNLVSVGSAREEIRNAVKAYHDSQFAEFIADSGTGLDVRTTVIQGNPHASTVAAARDSNADLVVVGLRGEGALKTVRAALMGSVAKTLLKESPCPVVVVRPDHKL
jgi:nucleotide-binding universal stress UspA family protein